MDTSSAVLRTYGLFDFADGDPAVATLSSISKPVLPVEDDDDSSILVKSWISSGKQLTIW